MSVSIQINNAKNSRNSSITSKNNLKTSQNKLNPKSFNKALRDLKNAIDNLKKVANSNSNAATGNNTSTGIRANKAAQPTFTGNKTSNTVGGSSVGKQANSVGGAAHGDLSALGDTAKWVSKSKGEVVSVNSDKGLKDALKNAKPGQRIQLQSGRYELPNLSNLKGTQGNPITIESAPGQKAILDGSKGSNSQTHVKNSSHLNIQNLEITNAKKSPLYIEQSDHIFANKLNVHHNNRGVDVTNGSSHTIIANSESSYNQSIGNKGEGGDGFGFWSVPEADNSDLGPGNAIINSTAHHNSDDGFDLFKSNASVKVINNSSFDNGHNVNGLSGFAGDGNGFKLGPQGTGHIVTGNTATGNPAAGFTANGGSGGIALFANNISKNNKNNFEEVSNRQ